MKLLLDANVGTTIAKVLQQARNDVVRTVLLTPRATDISILARAVSDDRVLITYDSDFTDLIFRDKHQPPPALIYIRDDQTDLASLASKIADLVGSGLLLDHIHVVGEADVRHRKFPSE